MAQFNTSCSSVPDASSKLALRQKVCAESIQARIAALKGNLPGAANTTSTHTSYPENVAMTSAVKASTDVSNKTSVSLASAKPAWINYSRRESTTILKPETQESSAPSFPKVHQSTKLSLVQKNSAKPPKLPERQKPNYIRTRGTQNKVQRESAEPSVPQKSLPNVLSLGNPPPKPSRPPSVDLHRFRRNRKSLSEGPGMKIPRPVAPPPLHSCPSSSQAAALSRQMDEDESYDDVGIVNPPPLCSEEHPSKRTEEPKGTINSKNKKQQRAKDKREAKKKFKIKGPVHVIKRKKALVDFKGGKAKITEVVHSTDEHVKTESVDTYHEGLKEEEEPGTVSYQCGAESDVYDDIGAPADVCSGLTVQNFGKEDVYVDVDNPDTGLYSFCICWEWMGQTGSLVTVEITVGACKVDAEDMGDNRVSSPPQPTADGDDVYDDVDSQSHPLPSDGYDIYVDIKEDCIYEID